MREHFHSKYYMFDAKKCFCFFVIAEFREQLERLEKAIAKVPTLVVQEILKCHLQKSKSKLDSVAKEFNDKAKSLDQKRVSNLQF